MKIISFNELNQLFYLIRLDLASNILNIQRLANRRMNQNVMTAFRTSEAKPQSLDERKCVAEADIALRLEVSCVSSAAPQRLVPGGVAIPSPRSPRRPRSPSHTGRMAR